MLAGLGHLALFTAKALVIAFLILFVVVMVLVLAAKARDKLKGRLVIRNLNEKLSETKEDLLSETLPKSEFKKFMKERKAQLKEEKKLGVKKPNVFVLQFNGDISASALPALREEVTAILTVASPADEVVVKVESGGGMVHAYGLAASQLKRIRDKHIPLIVTVDKVAASGGYLMACVADRILAAPFAIIGSIGVIFQLPNFHRYLENKNIEFEQVTAGDYKRTLTMFGKNTEAGREKLQQELEDIHQHFTNLIQEYRRDVNVKQIATGEHWLASQAISLKLVDELTTSDDYLIKKSEKFNVYEINYETRKSFGAKLKTAMTHWISSRGLKNFTDPSSHADFIL